MATSCGMEMCPNWSGDGEVCMCALLDVPHVYTVCPDCGHEADTPNNWDLHVEVTGHGR
jgi:hypothetical protein